VLAKGAYNGLFLGLGAVALLVGGVGIANVMVISVLERRSEIGLRRALGATRRHIAAQFLTEAILLVVLGGLAGTITGITATTIYALTQHWHILIPPQALYGGLNVPLDGCLSRWAVDLVRTLGQGNHVAELILGQHLVYTDLRKSARLGDRSDHCCRAH
jgi:hypothetical protein